MVQAGGEARRAVHQAVSTVPATRDWLSELCHVTGQGWAGARCSCSSHLGPRCRVLSLSGSVRPCAPLGSQPWSGTGGWQWKVVPWYLGIYLPLDNSPSALKEQSPNMCE